MPQPVASDLNVNPILTTISVAFFQNATNFIADKVFPIVPVELQYGRYATFDRASWFRDQAQQRAPSTESAGGGFSVDTTPSYGCVPYAFHKDVDDQVRVNAGPILNLDVVSTNFVTNIMLLKREKLFVDAYFKAGVWTFNWTGVSGSPGANQVKQWDQATGANPIGDITKAINLMASLTGYRPNTLTIGPDVLAALKNCPQITDRIKYTSRDNVTTDILAAFFEVDRVLVPYGVINTAAEGAATANGFLYGKGALLTYAAPSPSLLSPSAGYIFAWTGLLGAGAFGNRISRFRMEQLRSDRIEGEMAIDPEIVAPDCGLYIASVVA